MRNLGGFSLAGSDVTTAAMSRRSNRASNSGEFATIGSQAGLNSYRIGVKEWSRRPTPSGCRQQPAGTEEPMPTKTLPSRRVITVKGAASAQAMRRQLRSAFSNSFELEGIEPGIFERGRHD